MSNSRGVSSRIALLIVLAAWAAIYLPGLGTLEIKGEEGRRILPAVTMLQTGNYIVPQIGSDPYFNKPPLVNWLVAASFKLFGVRNEWAARLPSVLCVLAVALAFITVARPSLGANGSLAAALIWMTNFGMVEKGRLIEIEALYVSLSGLAFICWLRWWQERRSSWLTWTVPWVFLGLGMLAKGPLHLVFFYAVVVAILYRSGNLRALLQPAHLVGVTLMVAIFAAWAIPCLQIMRAGDVAHTWSRQFSGRLSGEDFKLAGWIMNIPRGLAYFLPWTVLLGWALLRKPVFDNERTKQVASGLAWGAALSFIGISLLPGSLARYTLPLLVPSVWLAALLLASARESLPHWLSWRKPAALPPELRLPVFATVAVCLAIATYNLAVIPLRHQRAKVRPIAQQINAALTANEPLYAIDPEYQPALFYVRDPVVYLNSVADVPATARFLLVQPEREQEVFAGKHWKPANVQPILRLKDYRNKQLILLRIAAPE